MMEIDQVQYGGRFALAVGCTVTSIVFFITITDPSPSPSLRAHFPSKTLLNSPAPSSVLTLHRIGNPTPSWNPVKLSELPVCVALNPSKRRKLTETAPLPTLRTKRRRLEAIESPPSCSSCSCSLIRASPTPRSTHFPPSNFQNLARASKRVFSFSSPWPEPSRAEGEGAGGSSPSTAAAAVFGAAALGEGAKDAVGVLKPLVEGALGAALELNPPKEEEEGAEPA